MAAPAGLPEPEAFAYQETGGIQPGLHLGADTGGVSHLPLCWRYSKKCGYVWHSQDHVLFVADSLPRHSSHADLASAATAYQCGRSADREGTIPLMAENLPQQSCAG